MADPQWRDETSEHLQEVGLVCTQWAYLEWMLEISIWWFLGFLDSGDPTDGLTLTGTLNCESLARKASQLSHRKLVEAGERDLLVRVLSRVSKIVEERNLVVHGRRSVSPDEIVTATVSRGPAKNQTRPMPLTRIRSLNLEIGLIINELEPLLAKHGVVKTSAA